MRGADPWFLPAAQQFLTEIEPALWQGGAVIQSDVSTPQGLAPKIVSHLRDAVTIERVLPSEGELPLEVLGRACGQPGASMGTIVASGRFLLVEGKDLGTADLARWTHALNEFAARSVQANEAGAVLFIGNANVAGLARLDWSGRLRRADALIWAEFAVPSGRNEIVQRLAVDLAVELCGWRLDLVADLVSQRQEDILDPMGWMVRNLDQASAATATFGASEFACPLKLMAKGETAELRRRIWTAQLSVLFPWIEGHRQALIERYRRHLFLDEHLRAFGVTAVDDIELGGLRRQLGRILVREEADRLTALAKLRNDLAHRKPISPADFIMASQSGR